MGQSSESTAHEKHVTKRKRGASQTLVEAAMAKLRTSARNIKSKKERAKVVKLAKEKIVKDVSRRKLHRKPHRKPRSVHAHKLSAKRKSSGPPARGHAAKKKARKVSRQHKPKQAKASRDQRIAEVDRQIAAVNAKIQAVKAS